MSRFTQSVTSPYATTAPAASARCTSTRGFDAGSLRKGKSARRATSATTAIPVTTAPVSKRRRLCRTSSSARRTQAICHARRLPRASPRGGDEQRDRERAGERLRQPVHLRRVERGHERAPVLGQDRVQRPERGDRGDEAREQEPSARRVAPARSAREGAGDPGEVGRDHHCLFRGGRAERLVRRYLADDEDRDAVECVEPGSDGRGEQEPSRQAFGVRPAHEEPEERSRDAPHREIEEQRNAPVLRELVERERVVQPRARQRCDRSCEVQPAGGRDEHAEGRNCRGRCPNHGPGGRRLR
jgi:hypothetical protein